MNKLQLACFSTLIFGLINSLIVSPNLPSPLSYNPEALAKSKSGGSSSGGSSGGRSRGGSFSAPPKSAPKSGNSSDSPSNSNNNNNNNNNNQYAPGYQAPVYINPNPVIVTNGVSSNDGGGVLIVIVILLIMGGGTIALLLWWLGAMQKTRGMAGGNSKAEKELNNEIVTVTCLQIALLAEAREIQSRLIQLATESDLTTPEGLVAQLQESVLALLRSPENWTHGRSTSRTAPNLKEAEVLFEQMSITERQKFATETLVNVGGKIRRQQVALTPEPDIAEYIVVTLLVGTADDQPLFPEIHTEEDLKAALNRIAAISSDYLMIFELLWTPAEERDSLTYDQLLANYADMRQLV